MNKNDFKPGFEFEMRMESDPDKWEKIKIHPNCAQALINEVLDIFKSTPCDFRKVVDQKVLTPKFKQKINYN